MANSKIKSRSLEADAVDAAAIEDLAITNAKLAGSITNAKLANSSITIDGSPVALGASVTIVTKPNNHFTHAFGYYKRFNSRGNCRN